MKINEYIMEKIEDPFGILSGDRYEILLQVSLPEDDELYSPNGITIKTLWVLNNDEATMSHYLISENGTGNILEFELEEDEVQLIENFCRELFQMEE